MNTLRMAFRNVTRQRKRSILLGGAIAFGVMIITLVQSFTGGLIATANDRVTELLGGHIYISGEEVSGTGRIISVIRDQTPLEDALKLVAADTTEMRFRSSGFGEMIFVSKVKQVTMTGVDWAKEPSVLQSLDVIAGSVDALSDPKAIMLPKPIADELGVQVGESVLVRLTSITGQQNVGEFTVGGLLRDTGLLGMTAVYADKAYLNSLIGMSADQYQQVVLSVRDTSLIEPVAKTIHDHLASLGLTAPETQSVLGDQSGTDMTGNGTTGSSGGARRGGGGMMLGAMSGMLGINVDEADRWTGTRFSVQTINDVMQPLVTIMDILNQASLGLFLILLVITMVGLLNTFRMILIERTREIGTIRAVGMQRNQVRNLFLLEALILALGGAVAGLLLSLVLGTIASNIPITTDSPLVMFLNGNTFAFTVNPGSIISVLVILTVITLLSAYMPARKAALMRPADALRTNY